MQSNEVVGATRARLARLHGGVGDRLSTLSNIVHMDQPPALNRLVVLVFPTIGGSNVLPGERTSVCNQNIESRDLLLDLIDGVN